ncbi:uncharacterized protein LOC135592253 isoform X1 [Musa acuminata AAA Group]|uniref:uncharacterized protein LOC135592253 isoform X1 n=1 Tax=Musa acuminata AAA Group TaxID=214697 RepID=UPI0031D4DDC2
MEKAPTLAANRFHDDSNKEPETLEDKLMCRLSSFSTVIREAAMTKPLQNLFGATALHGGARGGGMRSIHSLRSLHRLTIRPISAGSSSKAKTRRVLLYLGRFGLQTLPGSSYFA